MSIRIVTFALAAWLVGCGTRGPAPSSEKAVLNHSFSAAAEPSALSNPAKERCLSEVNLEGLYKVVTAGDLGGVHRGVMLVEQRGCGKISAYSRIDRGYYYRQSQLTTRPAWKRQNLLLWLSLQSGPGISAPYGAEQVDSVTIPLNTDWLKYSDYYYATKVTGTELVQSGFYEHWQYKYLVSPSAAGLTIRPFRKDSPATDWFPIEKTLISPIFSRIHSAEELLTTDGLRFRPTTQPPAEGDSSGTDPEPRLWILKKQGPNRFQIARPDIELPRTAACVRPAGGYGKGNYTFDLSKRIDAKEYSLPSFVLEMPEFKTVRQELDALPENTALACNLWADLQNIDTVKGENRPLFIPFRVGCFAKPIDFGNDFVRCEQGIVPKELQE